MTYASRETAAALLVAIGAPRLRRLGIELPDVLPETPEHRLYELLARDEPDSAHSRYNAFIRKLVRFERTAENQIYRDPALDSPSFRRIVEGVLCEIEF